MKVYGGCIFHGINVYASIFFSFFFFFFFFFSDVPLVVLIGLDFVVFVDG